MHFSRIFVIVALTALLSGCVYDLNHLFAQYGTRGGDAQAATQNLDSILKAGEHLPLDRQIDNLRHLHNQFWLPQREKEECAYVLARCLQKGSSGDALPAAKEIIGLFEEAGHIPSLYELCQNQIIAIATASGLEKEVRSHIENLKARTKTTAGKIALDYALAQSFMRANEPAKAKQTFLAIRKEASESQFALGAIYYLAQIDISDNSGQITENAMKYFREYLRKSPDGKFALDIVKQILPSASVPMGSVSSKTTKVTEPAVSTAKIAAPIAPSIKAPELTTNDHLLCGQAYYAAEHWQQALAQWQAIDSDAKLLEKADCNIRLNHGAEAQDYLLRYLAKGDPAGDGYASVAALICQPLTRDQAIALWKKILTFKPPHQDIALWNIGSRLSLADGEPYYKRILSGYSKSTYAPESLWWIFWHQVQLHHRETGKLAPLISMAHSGMKQYPKARAAARFAFWAGKLNEWQHKPDQAKTDYDFAVKHFAANYYGQRARVRLAVLSGKDKLKRDRGWSTNSSRQEAIASWDWPQPQDILSQAAVEKLYGDTTAELLHLRQYDQCVSELPTAARADFKAALFAAQGDDRNAIKTAAQDLAGAPSAAKQWQMAYPLAFQNEIGQAAGNNHVDPYLIQALIREESHFNPLALSHSNAIGLMQLMPGTAYGVAKRIGIRLAGTEDIMKPEINIKLGTHYFAYVLDRADGNALLAVASYNGGPGAVQAWLKEHRSQNYSDFDSFVENIAFRETRDYVRKVFGSYWTYEQIYSAAAKSLAR